MAFWDMSRALSYNCLFNMIIGSRGVGKSYGLKKRVIKLFLEKGYEFVYLRRHVEELEQTAEKYFDDIMFNNEFPEHRIEYRAGVYYVDGKQAGYTMALTKAKDYKSISFPKVMTIIFDEFLIEENGYTRYLKNEVKTFLGLYMSVDRYRGVTVFFLANATTMVNPYTMFFKISLPYGSNFVRKGDILLELVQNEEFIQEKKQTRFGKLIEGTDFADYAIDNKFMYDNKQFICKKSEKSQYYFTFIYKGVSYGVWIDYKVGRMYISENVDPSCGIVYAITNEEHAPNTMLLTNINKSPFFKKLLENYKMGNVFFESQRIKNITYEVIGMCIN